MTDSKRHLLEMIVERTIESMDLKTMIAFVEEVLYHDYESWSEQDLKSYLNALDN